MCAICNKYLKPLCSSNPTDETLGCKLLHLSKQNNSLMERVTKEQLDKQYKSKWESIDASKNHLRFSKA